MIEIREYSKKDRLKVIRCVRRIKNELGWLPVNKKYAPDLYDIAYSYMKENGNFWILTDGDKVIGTCGLQDMKDKIGFLRRFYIDKDYRSNGFGKELFSKAVEYAQSRGYSTVYLGTGTDATTAIKLYEKFGFNEINSLPQDLCIPAETYYQLNLNG